MARAVALQYLGDWAPRAGGDAPDVLVLGCTHYPMLKPVLAEVLGPGVALIDSAEATAAAVAPYLQGAPVESAPLARFIVTDGAPGFARVAERLLGEAGLALEVVDLHFGPLE